MSEKINFNDSIPETTKQPESTLSEKLVERGLDGITPEKRLEIIDNASIEDFKDALSEIHKIVSPESDDKEHPNRMKITSPTGEERHLMAAPEERDGIYSEALSLAKELVRKYEKEGGSIDDTLQRIGNIIAFSIVLAHPYENGNGRTARTFGEIIHNGYNSSDPVSVKDLETVSSNRLDKGFRINSYVPKVDDANENPIDFLKTVAALDVPLDGSSYKKNSAGKFTTPRMG